MTCPRCKEELHEPRAECAPDEVAELIERYKRQVSSNMEEAFNHGLSNIEVIQSLVLRIIEQEAEFTCRNFRSIVQKSL